MRSRAFSGLATVWVLAFAIASGQPAETNRSLGGGTIVVRLVFAERPEAPPQVLVAVSGKHQRIPRTIRMTGVLLEIDVGQPDEYQLKLEVPGYKRVERTVLPSHFAGGRAQLNVAMERESPAKALGDGTENVVRADTLQIPENAQRELEKAAQAADRGDLSKALKHLGKAIEICPQFHQAYNNRGAVYLRLQDHQRAEADFRESLRLQPDSPPASRNLAHLLVATGRYSDVLPLLESRLERHPMDAWAHTYLGEALYQMKRQPQAEAHLKKALRLDSEAYLASYRLGAISLERGDKVAALRYFKLFLSTNAGIEDPSIEPLVQKLEKELGR